MDAHNGTHGIYYTIYNGKRIISIKLCACLLTVRNRAVNRGKRASVSSLSTVHRIRVIGHRGPPSPLVERLTSLAVHHRVLAIVYQLRRLQLVHSGQIRGQKFVPTFLLLFLLLLDRITRVSPASVIPRRNFHATLIQIRICLFSLILSNVFRHSSTRFARRISVQRFVSISRAINQRGIVLLIISLNDWRRFHASIRIQGRSFDRSISILVRGTLVPNNGRPAFHWAIIISNQGHPDSVCLPLQLLLELLVHSGQIQRRWKLAHL